MALDKQLKLSEIQLVSASVKEWEYYLSLRLIVKIEHDHVKATKHCPQHIIGAQFNL